LVPSRLSDCDSVSDLISTVPAFSLVPSCTTSHNSGLPATFSGSIESVSSIDVPDSLVVSSLNSGPNTSKSLGSEVIEKSRVFGQPSSVPIEETVRDAMFAALHFAYGLV
jgi:hypothetical protein